MHLPRKASNKNQRPFGRKVVTTRGISNEDIFINDVDEESVQQLDISDIIDDIHSSRKQSRIKKQSKILSAYQMEKP